MIEYEWKTGYCEYLFEDPADQNGNVKVTTLHWNCSASDPDNSGIPPVTNIGTVNAADQNRVYTLAALQNVPESVMTGWVKQALGDEEVASIEEGLERQYNEAAQPSGGGITPSE
jgi:hypothetical protein